jgi:hypothetical protein
VLVGLLILGNAYAGESVGKGESYAPANRLTALQTISPLHFLDGIISGGVLGAGVGDKLADVLGGGGNGTAASVFSTPEKGGMVLPLELWLLYNALYNDALGGLGAELGALNLGNVLPRDH